jgi:hypothetical protein
MAKVWEAPEEIKNLVKELQQAHHPHLAQASIWVLVKDAKCIVDNRLVVTDTKRTTNTEKYKTNHDFKISITMSGWKLLTDAQQRVAIDEALCRCGVHYMPQTITINNKEEVVKDDLGRTIYTSEISTDDAGVPRWKINKPDAALFFGLLQRRGQYNEEAENAYRALTGQPLLVPTAAEQASLGEESNELNDEPEITPTPDGGAPVVADGPLPNLEEFDDQAA